MTPPTLTPEVLREVREAIGNRITPLPWHADSIYTGAVFPLPSVSDCWVMGDGREADAHYIALACNHAPAMLDALESSAVEIAEVKSSASTLATMYERQCADLAAKEAENVTLAARVRELEAIVGKLPATADGVPVVPGVEVYLDENGFGIVPGLCGQGAPIDIIAGPVNVARIGECYSSRDAALSARGDTGVG